MSRRTKVHMISVVLNLEAYAGPLLIAPSLVSITACWFFIRTRVGHVCAHVLPRGIVWVQTTLALGFSVHWAEGLCQ